MVVRAPGSGRSLAQADERLLVEAAQKDPTRFGDLYERHFGAVYAFAARRSPNREMAEDVTADTFHRALSNLRQFEWRGVPFGAWLLRIAANAVVDRCRNAGKELSFENPPEIASEADFESFDKKAQLYKLVEELPEDQRQVVVMRFAEEKSIRDIATRMGRSEGAVKQLQFRGLQNLRDKLTLSDAKSLRARRSTKTSKKSGGRNG